MIQAGDRHGGLAASQASRGPRVGLRFMALGFLESFYKGSKRVI